MTMTPAATRSTPTWLIMARILFTSYARTALWFWAVIIVVLIAGHILMSGIIPGRALIARYAVQPLIWFTFSVAIIFAYTYLPVHVTSGMTRRAFIRAFLAAIVLIALLQGVLLALVVGVERSVFAGATDAAAGQGPFVHWHSLWGIGLAQLLVTAAAALSGLLVAMAYYRTSPVKGTAALILTVPPLLAVLGLVAAEAEFQAWLGLPTSLTTPALASLAVLAAMTIAFYLITRNVPIRTVEQS